MTDRILPDIANPEQWQLLTRRSLVGIPNGRRYYYPPQKVDIPTYVCMVGVKNPEALDTWFVGAWASVLLPITPASGTGYPAAVDVARRNISLGQFNLVTAPKLVAPWQLQLTFPPWHQLINFEVWAYQGEDLDEFMILERIEAKLNEP